jgi:hypothetical protein
LPRYRLTELLPANEVTGSCFAICQRRSLMLKRAQVARLAVTFIKTTK